MENTIRIATGGIAEELRKMEVGDVVKFPMDRYNPSTMRSAPTAVMYKERGEGRNWKTKSNFEEQFTEVTRVS